MLPFYCVGFYVGLVSLACLMTAVTLLYLAYIPVCDFHSFAVISWIMVLEKGTSGYIYNMFLLVCFHIVVHLCNLCF